MRQNTNNDNAAHRPTTLTGGIIIIDKINPKVKRIFQVNQMNSFINLFRCFFFLLMRKPFYCLSLQTFGMHLSKRKKKQQHWQFKAEKILYIISDPGEGSMITIARKIKIHLIRFTDGVFKVRISANLFGLYISMVRRRLLR